MPDPLKVKGTPLPGIAVTVQLPGVGKLESGTLPELRTQVGWVTIPAIGADGPGGKAFIVVIGVAADWQPVTKLIIEKV